MLITLSACYIIRFINNTKKGNIMKKYLLVALVIVMVLAAAAGCSKAEPLSTSLGDFEYEQVFTKTLGDETAGQDSIFLVIYLKPAEGNAVTMDEAQKYFYSGVQARVAGLEYDLSFLAYEKVDNSFLRYGLVFEVLDDNYENAKQLPEVTLILP